MAEPVAIGVDIGGTATKLGLVTRSGAVIQRGEVLTPHQLSGQTIVENITAHIAELVKTAKTHNQAPLGIGVSVCGYLTSDGRTPDYVNLHALDGYPLVNFFERSFNLPVVMDNDMNCGVLGEFHYGGGQGVTRLMVMTVGTGIGMAVMIDGQALRFHGGTVGNPGHVIVTGDGPVCPAGCVGCLESLASAGPISRRAEDTARSQRSTLLREILERQGSLSPEDLHRAAEAGDLPAQEIWSEVGVWLGRGLASWVEIFGPEVVIVGGGVAKAGLWLIDPIEKEMRRLGEPYFTRRVKEVKQSHLGKDIAMLGAVSMIHYPEHAPVWAK